MTASEPTVLRVRAASLDSIFEGDSAPAFPSTGRSLRADLASCLERKMGERPRGPSFEIELRVDSPASDHGAEDRTRQEFRTYVLETAADVQLDVRVNPREGWRFLRRGDRSLWSRSRSRALYQYGLGLPSGPRATFATAVVGLFFITIVWVVLWGPIE